MLLLSSSMSLSTGSICIGCGLTHVSSRSLVFTAVRLCHRVNSTKLSRSDMKAEEPADVAGLASDKNATTTRPFL